MYLLGVNIIICILLEVIVLLLKNRIDKSREIENTHELEINGMLSDVSVNYREGSIFSYNYGTKELTKKKIVHYTDYIKLAHEYSHAIHNEVTGYDNRLWAFFGLIILFLVLLTLVLLLIVFLMDKVIFILALSCLSLYFIYYLFVVYIEVSANTILLKKRNIKEDKLVVAYIILNMVNEFVFRLLGFVVLYSIISKV
jgi:hypothetical protein